MQMLNKFLIILIILLGGMVKAQSVDTLANVEIKVLENKVYTYCWHGLDTANHSGDEYIHLTLIADSLQPQLKAYIDIVEHDYMRGDTLVTIMFQSISQSLIGQERFIIQGKNSVYFPVMSELSQTMQYALYVFGEKIKANIRKGYYEN